jgi:hypothetical protein
MKIGIPIYLLGVSLTMIKVYYDSQTVSGYENKLIISLMADLLLILSVIFSFFPKTRIASVTCGALALPYFYVVLGFGGRGSAELSCNAAGICTNTVDYTCENINDKPISGALFLMGSGLKIVAATLILRSVWGKYRRGTLDKIIEMRNVSNK